MLERLKKIKIKKQRKLTKIEKIRLYAHVGAISCLFTVWVTFIHASINGLSGKGYYSIIKTNTYNEHWFEVVLIFSFIVAYVIILCTDLETIKKQKKDSPGSRN